MTFPLWSGVSVVSVGGMEVEAPQAPRTRRRKRPVGWEMGPLHSRLWGLESVI